MAFKDFSTNNFQLTAFGNAQISTAQKKYGTGSAYFNGSSSLQTNALTLGTSDFTLEAWIFPTTNDNGENPIFNQGNTDSPGAFIVSVLGGSNAGKFHLYAYGDKYYSTNTVPLNIWTHIAVARQVNTFYFFINGNLDGSYTADLNESSFGQPNTLVFNFNQTPFKIGDGYGGIRGFQGYIDDLRITKGIARYTENFTPPTSELPRPSDPHGDNVSLLLHMDGLSGSQTFTDSSSNNFTLSAFGDAQISTSVKKLGSGAGYFDGSGDRITTISDPAFAFGTGDFTVELWINPDATGSQQFARIIQCGDYPNGWQLVRGTTGGDNGTSNPIQLMLDFVGGSPRFEGGILQNNQWSHVAVTRESGTVRIFVNGILSTSGAGTTNLPEFPLVIGSSSNGGEAINAYIDELRVTKGVARYTSNFVPHTAPFANPPFTPTSISGLQLWLDGSDSSTMYDATVGGSLVAADGAIARWEDKSGNGKHATQSTSNNRPLRRLSQQNGLDGVEFDGNDDFVEGSQILSSQPYTVIAVCKFTDTIEVGCYFGQTTGFIPFIYKWGTGGEKLRIFNDSNLTSNNSVSNGTWYVLRNVGNTSNSQIYINNVLDITGSNGSGTPGGNYIIANFNNSQYQGLVYGELLVYNKVLTTEEATQVEEYLNNKWNVY